MVCIFKLNPQSISLVAAKSDTDYQLDIPEIEYKEHEVYIALYLSDMFQFNYRDESYTNDMYIIFLWSDLNIITIDWQLVNGVPVYSGARILVSDNFTEGEIRGEIYRITANIFSSMEVTNYPFDQIELPIIIEIIQEGYRQSFVWITSESYVNPEYNNEGWEPPEIKLLVSRQNYSFGASVPRATFVVVQSRSLNTAVVTTIVPPLLFCIISAFGFLFHLSDPNGVGLRIGVTSSVLVTAILFNLSILGSIPPPTGLTFWTVFMISVLSFLTMNLLVTIMGYVEFRGKKREKRFKQINRWGALLSIVIPILLFVLLYVLK